MKLVYYDPTGVITTITKVATLDATRSKNQDGTFSLTLPGKAYNADFFKEGGRFKIYRKLSNAPEVYFGKTDWFINRITKEEKLNAPKLITIEGYDTLGFIKSRQVSYDTGNYFTEKVDFADDMIKEVVNENFATKCFDEDRNMADIVKIQGNVSNGMIVEKDDLAWKNCLTACQEIADQSAALGIDIVFDLVPLGNGTYEFRTWTYYQGQDRGLTSNSQCLVSPDNGRLTDITFTKDYSEEVNAMTAIGDGTELARVSDVALDAARIGRSRFSRKEGNVNINSSDATVVYQGAERELKVKRPKKLLSGRILESAQFMYGINFDYGDKLVARYDGEIFDVILTTVSLKITREAGESIELQVSGSDYL